MPSGAATALLVCVWQCRKGPALVHLATCNGAVLALPPLDPCQPRGCHVDATWHPVGPFSSATLTVGVPAPLLLAAAATAAAAPPWQYWIPLQNRGWAAGTPQHLPRDVHAGGQALKMPGCKSARGVRWRRRRRDGPTLAPLVLTPKPRLGCGKASLPPRGRACKTPGSGGAWLQVWKGGSGGGGGSGGRHHTGTTLAPLSSSLKPRLGCGDASVPLRELACRSSGLVDAWVQG